MKALLLLLILCGCQPPKTPSIKLKQEVIQARNIKPFTTKNRKITWPAFCHKKISINIQYGENVLDVLTKILPNINVHHDLEDVHNITYKATNKTCLQILKDICNQCHWKLQISDQAIFISRDSPYIFIHTINVLNTQASSSIRTGVNEPDKNSMNIGSSATVNTQSHNNAWEEVETYLRFLIMSYKQDHENQHLGQKESHTRLLLKQQEEMQNNIQNIKTEIQQQIDQNKQTITTRDIMSVDDQEVAKLAPTTEKASIKPTIRNADISYAFNKQAGLIILKAPQSIHKAVAQYIHNLEEKISAQVRVEAKIIEVNLKDEFHMGIDWNNVTNLGGGNKFEVQTDNASPVSFALQDHNISGVIHALQKYGDTHIVSKPELTILHNEIGFFKVVTNKVYFKLRTFETLNYDKNAQSNVIRTSDAHVLPLGFNMTIQPSIDTDTGDVLLHIRPSLTSSSESVPDPSVQLSIDKNKHDSVSSEYPIVESKEFDTKLKLQPGQWAVLGGYIISAKHNHGKGLPGMKIAAGLLGKQSHAKNKTEIVCLLRAYPENSNHVPLACRIDEIHKKTN